MQNFFSHLFHSMLKWFRPSRRARTEQPISPAEFQKMLAQTLADPDFKLLLLKSMAGPVFSIEGGFGCPTVSGPSTNSTAGTLTKWADNACTLADSVVTESSSNIGIGLTTTPTAPSEKLDIEGSFKMRKAENNNIKFQATGYTTPRFQMGISGDGGMQFQSLESTTRKFYLMGHLGIAYFQVDMETGDLTEYGKIGIGVAPLNKLDVAGGAAIGSYAGANAAPTDGLIVSGNVGIGTASPNPQAKLDVSPTHAVTSGVENWSAVRIAPTLTGSGTDATDAIVGTHTEMDARPTGHKTFMYGYNVNVYPGGEQVLGDDQFDVNGYNVENGGTHRAESGFRVGGGDYITNGGNNPSKYAWVQGIEIDTSAETGISFRNKIATLAAPVLFGVGIDMSQSSFNTCGILLANGTSSGIRGEKAGSTDPTQNYRLIDIDGDNNTVIGAESAVVQGAPPSAPDDTKLNNSNISFWVDQSGNNLVVRVRYSNGTLKTGTVSLS